MGAIVIVVERGKQTFSRVSGCRRVAALVLFIHEASVLLAGLGSIWICDDHVCMYVHYFARQSACHQF